MGDYNAALLRNNQHDLQARTKQQNSSNVLQLKLIGQSHPTGLTNNLLKLFEARPPLEFKAPPEKRKCPPYTGMAQFVSNFAEKGDPEYQPPVKKVETLAQKKARIHKLRLDEGARKTAEELEKYDPHHNPDATGDPYKTLFVSKLNYETSERKIKREFEAYGPIKRAGFIEHLLRMLRLLPFGLVRGSDYFGKPRGYAFIEYMHTRDMKAAYKQADGKKIDGRRVLVDVERGRTVPNWRPRRLGGGLGTSRIGTEDNSQKLSKRESGGPSKSEEPRTRDDRQVDREREKSRERGREREREREKSHELSHDRPRDCDHWEERHSRDRDRARDKDRERESRRDRDRARDHDHGQDHGRDHDRDREHPRKRKREGDREREYEVGDLSHERGHSCDKDYNHVYLKRYRDQHRDRDRDREDHEYYEHAQGRAQYEDFGDQGNQDRYDHPDGFRVHDRYDQMGYDDHYERATSEQRERGITQDMDHEY